MGLIIIIISIGWHFHIRSSTFKQENNKIHFSASSRKLLVSSPDDAADLEGRVGVGVPSWQSPFHCFDEPETLDFTCLKWKDHAVLRIQHYGMSNLNCYNITWTPLQPHIFPKDCFSIGSSHWFGPSNTSSPAWSLKDKIFTFTSGNLGYYPSGTFDLVTEYSWVSSTGGMIVVDRSSPLKLEWNTDDSQEICLGSEYNGRFYVSEIDRMAPLKYTICNGNTILDSHKHAQQFSTRNLSALPSERLLEHPSYSVSGSMASDTVHENDITNLFNYITDNKLNGSEIIIDAAWETYSGDLKFNPQRFENLSSIANMITSTGMGLGLQVTPFISYKSENFENGSRNEYFMLGTGERVPGLVNASDMLSAVLDVTNPKAVSWVKSKLKELAHSYQIGAFHLKFSNNFWLPFSPRFSVDGVTPKSIKQLLVTSYAASSSDSSDGVSYNNGFNGFVDIPTNVKLNNDNQTCMCGVIETALTLGVLSYPYIRLVGSFKEENSVSQNNAPSKTSDDLYIRWLQLANFFPSMQYGIPPWEYENNTLNVARTARLDRQTIVEPVLKQVNVSTSDVNSIILPLWTIDPEDPVTYTVSDQFMVGDELLVAPVLCDKQTSRNIYIPRGIWGDPKTNALIKGGRWLLDYPADLNTIPYFIKKDVVGETELF